MRRALVLIPWLSALIAGCIHDPFGLLDETIEWRVTTSEHFVLHWQDDDPSAVIWNNEMVLLDGTLFKARDATKEEVVAVYLAYHEGLFAAFEQVFGEAPEERVDLYVYNNTAQQRLIGNGTAWAWIDYRKANGDGIAIHMVDTAYSTHELFHIFQTQIGSAGVSWMEGGATAVGGSSPIPLDREPYMRTDGRPTLPINGIKHVEMPYTNLLGLDGTWGTDGLYAFPLHRAAAMMLGVLVDPKYPLPPERVLSDARPSQIDSWVNVMTRDIQIPYVVCASFVHYLVLTHGWSPYVALYRKANNSPSTGHDVESVFSQEYGVTTEAAEQAWLEWLRTKPPEYFDGKIWFVQEIP